MFPTKEELLSASEEAVRNDLARGKDWISTKLPDLIRKHAVSGFVKITPDTVHIHSDVTFTKFCRLLDEEIAKDPCYYGKFTHRGNSLSYCVYWNIEMDLITQEDCDFYQSKKLPTQEEQSPKALGSPVYALASAWDIEIKPALSCLPAKMFVNLASKGEFNLACLTCSPGYKSGDMLTAVFYERSDYRFFKALNKVDPSAGMTIHLSLYEDRACGKKALTIIYPVVHLDSVSLGDLQSTADLLKIQVKFKIALDPIIVDENDEQKDARDDKSCERNAQHRLPDQDSAIVDIDTFIDNDYYLGKMWGGVHENGGWKGQPRVFPFWRKHLSEIFSASCSSPYTVVKIDAEIGTGKSTVMLLGLLYDLYKLLRMDDPHKEFGLRPETKIAVAYFVKNEGARKFAQERFYEAINASPFFQERLDKESSGRTAIAFKNGIEIHFLQTGSTVKNTLGTSYIAYAVDWDVCDLFSDKLRSEVTKLKNKIISRYGTQEEDYNFKVPFKSWEIIGENPDVKIITATNCDAKHHLIPHTI